MQITLLLCRAAFASCFLVLPAAVQAQVVLPDAEWCATPTLPLGKTGVGETDGPVVRALLVFVRFRDDELSSSIPGWPATPDRHTLPPIGTTLLAPSQATITASDSSFSRYYYDQSRASVSSPGTLQYFGDVWPRNAAGQPEVYVTKYDNDQYHRIDSDSAVINRGYGHLTKEILDSLVTQPGFDIGNYDLNEDGILDELTLLIRTDYQQRSRGGDTTFTYSGCADLDGCEFINAGRPSGTLAYTSPSQSRTVEIDWTYSGTHNLAWTPGNVVGQKYYVSLIGHEIGHHVLEGPGQVHIRPVSGNGVPSAQSTGSEQYGYALMASTLYGNMGGSVIMAAYERDRHGWLTTEVLTGSSRTVTLGDLYTTARAAVLPLGTSGKKLYLANRQRLSYFDRLQFNAALPAPYDRVAGGALASGLLATYTTGGYNIDVLPPDNRLKAAVWFDIPASYYDSEGNLYSNVNHHETDVYEPGKSTQITPWTRPNTSGFAGSGTRATWAAVDSIRYTGAADSSMAFEYVEDFRIRPIIRADSWIGAETANQTIAGNVLVRDGADLDINIGSGKSLTFAGTFTVNNGSVVTVGGTGQTITFQQGATINAGALFTVRAGTTIRMNSGKRLYISGQLNATGATFIGNPSWSGIYFASGSTGSINSSTLEQSGTYGGNLVTIYNRSPTVQNSTIRIAGGISHALTVDGGSAYPTIKDNDIEYNSTYEYDAVVFTGDAGGYFHGNTVTFAGTPSTSAALYASNWATPWFAGPPDYSGQNHFDGGAYGLSAYYYAGISSAGANTFCNQTVAELRARQYADVYAENNYFPGGTAPRVSISTGGQVSWSPVAGASHCSQSASGNGTQGNSEQATSEASNLSAEAAAEDANTVHALVALYRADRKQPSEDNLTQMRRRLSDRDETIRAAAMSTLPGMLARRGRTAEAIEVARTLTETYPGTAHEVYGRLKEASLLIESKQFAAALPVLDAMPEWANESAEVRSMRHIFEAERKGQVAEAASLSQSEGTHEAATESTIEVPDELTVSVQPNPSSGRTTIRYALPERSHVVVEVYDVMGRRVALLVDEAQAEGAHEAVFDGEDLSSGTYFYRVVTEAKTLTGTLLLVR